MDWTLDRILAGLSFVAAVAAGLSMDTKTRGELHFVQVSFVASAVTILFLIGAWGVRSQATLWIRTTVLCVMTSLVVVFLVQTLRWTEQRHSGAQSERESGTKEQKPASQAALVFEPLTMRELFKMDFDAENIFVMGQNADRNIPWINAKTGETTFVRVSEQVIFSPEANSYFVAFWIEPKGSAFTFEQCRMIGDHATSGAEDLLKSNPFTGMETDTKDLEIGKAPRFSGQVYIYEWDLDLQQMATLENHFKGKDMQVVFRGQEYLRKRNLQMQVAAKFVTPDSDYPTKVRAGLIKLK